MPKIIYNILWELSPNFPLINFERHDCYWPFKFLNPILNFLIILRFKYLTLIRVGSNTSQLVATETVSLWYVLHQQINSVWWHELSWKLWCSLIYLIPQSLWFILLFLLNVDVSLLILIVIIRNSLAILFLTPGLPGKLGSYHCNHLSICLLELLYGKSL